jgi:3-hydroxyisobutyrate dehydrogenase
MTVHRIAVLGLGIMGGGMAAQLLSKGFSVSVWNRNPQKAEALSQAGARVAATPALACADAEVVIAMLADDEASRAVWLGPDGAMAAMGPRAVAIESSTLTLDWIRELASQAALRGVAFLDAPVTGSKAQAHSGALRFVVGGEAEALELARPALEAMGDTIAHLGPAGSGALFKLANNILCGVQVASMAEALAMVEANGMDARKVVALLVDGAPGSPLVTAVSKRMLDRDYTPNFVPALMAKDLTYAAQAFAQAGIELKSAAAAVERFRAAARMGFGDQDIAAVIEPLRLAGDGGRKGRS